LIDNLNQGAFMIRQLVVTSSLLLSQVLTQAAHATQLCQNLFDVHNIDSYVWLEKRGTKYTDWVHEQNRRTSEDLKNRNYQATSRLVKKILDQPKISSRIQLRNHSEISIQDQGISKPKEVVLTRRDKSREVLFHSFQWKRNGSFNFVNISLSPSEKYLTVTAAENGTIDDFRVIVFNLETRKVISDELSVTHHPVVNVLDTHDTKVAWLSDTQFSVSAEAEILTYEIDQNHLTLKQKEAGAVVDTKSGLTVLQKKDFNYFYQTLQPVLKTDLVAFRSIIATIGTNIYLLSDGPHKLGEVVRVSRGTEDPKLGHLSILTPESNWVTSRGEKIDELHLALYRYWGLERRIDILNVDTKTIDHSILLPSSAEALKIELNADGTQYEITLTSPVVASRKYSYDLKSKSFLGSDPEIDMMTREGVQYKTEYIFAKSKDGTMIPVRVVSRWDLSKNGLAPGLAYTYGGFGVMGYLHPSFNPFDFEFLKRGGVLIAPGVRGGSEYGEVWHQQGMKEHKNNVMDDLNASLETLQKLKYIDARKTISTGWSNGGLVTASAALQRPELYGLVIPGAGVQDYLNTQKNDARYDGWEDEYGDANSSDRDFMKLISPVELAKNAQGRGPVYLIAKGEKDSRVNPSNSDKLAYAAQKHFAEPSNVYLMSINNAGHWMTSATYQDVIAWRSNSVIWSYIFTTAGIDIAIQK
jgi:prolyl oligopeptidase PreP (S9A serine peptidase family)